MHDANACVHVYVRDIIRLVVIVKEIFNQDLHVQLNYPYDQNCDRFTTVVKFFKVAYVSVKRFYLCSVRLGSSKLRY